MYQIFNQQFHWKMPPNQQLGHLLDYHHLPHAHKLTLFGLQIKKVLQRKSNHTILLIQRFGIPSLITLKQDGFISYAIGSRFKLRFEVIPINKQQHILDVSLYSPFHFLTYFSGIIGFTFWLTVLEDKLYFKSK